MDQVVQDFWSETFRVNEQFAGRRVILHTVAVYAVHSVYISMYVHHQMREHISESILFI